MQARGNLLVSGSGDRTLRLWQLDSGTCIATLEGHRDAVTCLTLAGESGDTHNKKFALHTFHISAIRSQHEDCVWKP